MRRTTLGAVVAAPIALALAAPAQAAPLPAKPAAASAVPVAAVPAAAAPAVSAASAVAARKTNGWDLSINPTENTTKKYYKANSSFISIRWQSRRGRPSMKFKIVKCGGGNLGPWVDIKRRGVNYVMTNNVVRKGTCFRIKSSRSFYLGHVWGLVNH
ncbi:hypothetical protein [Bailinhaonella thermotolerans]|uniref:Uncharacterized protein n=1 Tax=Bailinhaonella thermotolerans TaxID=1070861 RepID=A0A3A4AVW3_9ACTN|nr:hypothetical protein [Bailinhaonella thermotolerans]RJL33985.1 hypothetical protein D5H75_05515 [Bailinhaonella thermotolerans]